jgi:GNAT superfamily N-acetyltransferase
MPSSSERADADVEAGLCASWARQVGLSGAGRLARLGGLLVALSGVPDQTQQVALVERPVLDPSASVAAAESLFLAAGWDPAFDLVSGAHPALEETLATRGYQVVVRRPAMVRPLDGTTRDRGPRDVEVSSATLGQLVELARVQSAAFGMDERIARAMLPPVAATTAGLEVLVATDASGAVIGGLALHIDDRVVGVVGAAVTPECQRKGIGRTLTEVALARAAAAGARTAWLQATPAGSALWTSAGFVEVGMCEVWLVSHQGVSELHGGPRPTGL